jgi:hypothetical protein
MELPKEVRRDRYLLEINVEIGEIFPNVAILSPNVKIC